MTNKDYIKEFNNRREKAWKYFYEDYYAAMCSYANRVLKNKNDAEDIVQSTFLKIWEKDISFDTLQELTWYLYKSIYLNSLNFIQRREFHINLLVHVESEGYAMQDEDFANAIRQELIRQLRQAVDELPIESRKIVRLGLDGLSGLEIAEKLNISIHTVKSQKKRCLKILRMKLKDYDMLILLLNL